MSSNQQASWPDTLSILWEENVKANLFFIWLHFLICETETFRAVSLQKRNRCLSAGKILCMYRSERTPYMQLLMCIGAENPIDTDWHQRNYILRFWWRPFNEIVNSPTRRKSNEIFCINLSLMTFKLDDPKLAKSSARLPLAMESMNRYERHISTDGNRQPSNDLERHLPPPHWRFLHSRVTILPAPFV